MSQLIEQETTITAGRAEDVVFVYTNVPKHLRRLRLDKRATEIMGGEEWGRFRIPSDQFDALRGFKRQTKPMTEEQRTAAAARLNAARSARA